MKHTGGTIDTTEEDVTREGEAGPIVSTLMLEKGSVNDAPAALTVSDGGTAKLKRLGALDIKRAHDYKTRDVFVPEWDGVVTLQSLTSREKDEHEISQKRDDEGNLLDKAVRAKYVARCMVDENGERIIADGDVEWFASKSTIVMERLYTICVTLNTETQDARDAVVKNSDAGPGDDS